MRNSQKLLISYMILDPKLLYIQSIMPRPLIISSGPLFIIPARVRARVDVKHVVAAQQPAPTLPEPSDVPSNMNENTVEAAGKSADSTSPVELHSVTSTTRATPTAEEPSDMLQLPVTLNVLPETAALTEAVDVDPMTSAYAEGITAELQKSVTVTMQKQARQTQMVNQKRQTILHQKLAWKHFKSQQSNLQTVAQQHM